MEVLAGFYSVAIPVLFWAGIVYWIYLSIASDETSFLGSPILTQCYGVVVFLFVLGLFRNVFKFPILFGTIAIEYSLIILVLGSVIGGHVVLKKWRRQKQIKDDPTVKQCKKCGAVVEKVFIRCPDCNADITQ